LCYVGMTRAKNKLFLTFASQRLYFGKTDFGAPSRFLEDIPKKLLQFEEDDLKGFDLDDGWNLDDD